MIFLKFFLFKYNKTLFSKAQTFSLSSLEKKGYSINTDVIELLIEEDHQIKEEKIPHEKRLTKMFTLSDYPGVIDEDIEIFKSYVNLSDINIRDNFQVPEIDEEIQFGSLEITEKDFEDYLNKQVDTYKLLRDSEEDSEEISNIQPEMLEIFIIENYIDECQPPMLVKCSYQNYN